MRSDESSTNVLRFEIEVNGNAYRSLVTGLRSQHAPRVPQRPARGPIRALIDLDLHSQSFFVSKLGRHKLPRSLTIRTGSSTHNNLAAILSSALRDDANATLFALMRNIIAACPELPNDLLRIHQEDLELLPQGTPARDGLQPAHYFLTTLAPTVLLDVDDTPTLIVRDQPSADLDRAGDLLKQNLQVLTLPHARVVGNFAEIRSSVIIPALTDLPIDVFAHWGSYEELSPPWQDEHVGVITPDTPQSSTSLYFRTHVPERGWYGATFFAQIRGSAQRIWIGNGPSHDASFFIPHDDATLTQAPKEGFLTTAKQAQELLKEGLATPETFEKVCEQIRQVAPHISLGALMAQELTFEQTVAFIERRKSSSAQYTLATGLLDTILATHGVGEIVFASPEGPHAAAGGLGQVISSLPPELCKAGLPLSIIAPLYRYGNGNKHEAAETILEQGVQLDGEYVKPTYLGSITVQLGPSVHPGTSWHKRAPSNLPIKVYLAQRGKLRLFLLANTALFDRLYQPVYGDEQMRRAIAFSRAILETISTEHFGIRPSVIISNDWITACVPAFAALDERYRQVSWIRSSKTVHMIHNGGADYHGRLPLHFHGEDLWPMFNLAREHFFGFQDPHKPDLINFTMAAAHHVTGGILTVSEPYAAQLTSLGGGDGLENVLGSRREGVFGISNGINRTQIDSFLAMLAGCDIENLKHVPSLLTAKGSIKTNLQRRYGLAIRQDAILASFVGRLAEQKGLPLLSGFVESAQRSALEELLIKHPNLQIIVAGPLTVGDRTADDLRNCLSYLSHNYPGRVAAVFDYIPHTTALEIIFGSALFLMPSRFEPGGITQLEALAAGTLVVGRNIGGISATIENYNEATSSGNGFLCNDYTPTAFANTAHWALTTISSDVDYQSLVINAISARHAWSDRVPAFMNVLRRIVTHTN